MWTCPAGTWERSSTPPCKGASARASANDACAALTYNQRARACFPKGAGAGLPVAFPGALSGRVQQNDVARAAARAAALPQISGDDLTAARTQAMTMAAQNLPSAEVDPMARAAQAEAAGDMDSAARLLAQLVAQDDAAARWADLSRVTLTSGRGRFGRGGADGGERLSARGR